MSLGSTLSELAGRFTREEQSVKLDKFAKDTPGLSDPVRTQLANAVERSINNINWDKTRLAEVTQYWKSKGGDAAQVLVNFSVILLSLIMILVLN